MARTKWTTKRKKKKTVAKEVNPPIDEVEKNQSSSDPPNEELETTVPIGERHEVDNEKNDEKNDEYEKENEEEGDEDENENEEVGDEEENEKEDEENGESDNEEEEDNEEDLAGEVEEDGSNRSTDSEDELTALRPLKMYFPPTEYKKKIKLSTRCYIYEALKTLENLNPPLTPLERGWFESHPQFKHVFHLARDKSHKVMGMWMLLLRTACIEKEKEVWFVVNGVPIRYGLREHALISGLDCHNYPVNYMREGSMNFVKRHFQRPTIRHQDVKEKLEEMGSGRDRLKMAVLYFLSSIIIGQTKTGADATPVLEFFQRAVHDLELCRTFPWGRLSFDHMVGEITHDVSFWRKRQRGCIMADSRFLYSYEAFEAIPVLRNRFREAIPGADMSCPLMCKTRFNKSEMKGFPLESINEHLGRTKDIDSILIATEEESSLLSEIWEKDDDDDKCDVVVESWMSRLNKGYAVVFEEMYKEDVASRLQEEPENPVTEVIAADDRPVNTPLNDLVEIVNAMKNEFGEKMNKLEKTVDGLVERVAPLEAFVQEHGGETSKKRRLSGVKTRSTKQKV